MTGFTGFCSYPHGGYSSLGLFASCGSALAATTYAVASCRFLRVTFTSTTGSFEDSFSAYSQNTSTQAVAYTISSGLFQWLRPYSTTDLKAWDTGSCAGYQQSMLDSLSGGTFELARGFGVFAVLVSFVLTLWTFSSACLHFNKIQLYLMRLLLLAAIVCSGMTFAIVQAPLCTSLFVDRSCALDEGGLIMVAALILWMVALLVSFWFFTPSSRQTHDYSDRNVDHKQVNRLEREIRASRQAQDEKRQKMDELRYQQSRNIMWTTDERQRPTRHVERVLVDDVSSGNELEVYIAQRLDNIDRLIEV